MMQKPGLPEDPLYYQCFNEGLEWAACWLEESSVDQKDQAVVDFAAKTAEAFRAAKMPTEFQQDFFTAIRNDPYMSPEQKAYWLSLEEETRKANSD